MQPPTPHSDAYKSVVSFTAGAFYGFTSVVVGQPFDTIKTRQQASAVRQSGWKTGVDLFAKEGVRGLYRGGAPLFVGGALIRSAQFGVFESAMTVLGGPAKSRVFGVFDVHVIVAGFCGGVGRGLVESPFEFVKVRRQVDQPWKLRDVYRGSGVTLVRNSILFMNFMVVMDVLKKLVPGGDQLGPFVTGAVCSNVAWFSIWPLDVLKSRRQSGLYEGGSALSQLRAVVQSGALFRGLLPGLARSTVANGCSMFVFDKVKTFMLAPR